MIQALLLALIALTCAADPAERVVFFDAAEPDHCHQRSLVALNTLGGYELTDEVAFEGTHSLKVTARFTPEQRTVSFFWVIPDVRARRLRCRVRSTVPGTEGNVFLRSALTGCYASADPGTEPTPATVWGAYYGAAHGSPTLPLADLRLPEGAVIRAAPLPPDEWTTYDIALPADIWPAPPAGTAEMVCSQVWVFLEVPVDTPLFGRECTFYLDLLELLAPLTPATPEPGSPDRDGA